MNSVTIYTLSNPTTAEIRYVGMTRDLPRRLKQYQSETGGHTRHLKNWLKSIAHRPVLLILEEVPLAGADDRERFWIAQLREYGARLINYTNGGEGGYEWDQSVTARIGAHQRRLCETGTHNFQNPEIRARAIAGAIKAQKGVPKPWMSVLTTQRNIARTGIPLSAERRKAVSIAVRLHPRVWTDAQRIEMSAIAQDRWLDPAYRAAMVASGKRTGVSQKALDASADARRGKRLTSEHRAKVSAGITASWTPARRAAASIARKGKLVHPMTPEIKAKIAATVRALHAAGAYRHGPDGRIVAQKVVA
jgi:GIY-YIG catalytic domain